MAWVFAVLLVALIGGVVVVAAGRGEAMSPAVDDDSDPHLPEGPITAAGLREVRFNVAFRGYRAEEVDQLIERLVQHFDGEDSGPGDVSGR
jgi:DivIVA domain-containing protein